MSMYSPENNKKIKNNYDRENTYLNDNLYKSKVGKSYYDIIVKGVIWSFMLLVSFVGLVLVFKDNYSNKEVIIVSSKNNSYMKDNTVNLNNFEDSISEENKSFLNKYAKDEDITATKKEFDQNTQITKKNLNENSNSASTNNIQNKLNNNINNSKNLPQESNNTLSNLIQEVTNNNTSGNEVEKNNIIASSSTPSINNSANLSKAWLVTIYSSPDLSKAKSMWIEIQNRYSNLFNNKKVYFIKTNIPGKGTYYRVSLGDKQVNNVNPIFKTSKDASNYCNYLKDNNVNCFITLVEPSSLDKLN